MALFATFEMSVNFSCHWGMKLLRCQYLSGVVFSTPIVENGSNILKSNWVCFLQSFLS